MLPLICPVRSCTSQLEQAGPALRCQQGHTFDQAREGYWNLLQPQDKKSSAAGDARESVEARRRWLDRGFASDLARTVRATIDALIPNSPTNAVDAGCGEGTMTAATTAAPGREIYGIDLSVPAIRLATRRLPEATWIVANADRRIPLKEGSVDLVISMFGRRNPTEFARVLRPGGHCVTVVPGPDDLAELREAAQGSAERRDRVPGVVVEMDGIFRLRDHRSWRERHHHDRAAIDNALAMSYRGARQAERERTAGLTEIDVTLSAEILVFERAVEPTPRGVPQSVP